MIVRRILALSRRYIIKIRRRIELSRYDNFTIAEYFRKQGAQIGEGCMIVPRTLGTEPYLVKLGNHVNIAPDAHLHTHDGGTWVFRKEIPDLRVFGPIVIEDNCMIGANAQIMPNVRIGRNSIVGVNSVVISDVPPDSIVMGVPARRFGSVSKYKEKCIERWKAQRPPGLSPEASKHYEQIEDLEPVLRQLREHLSKVFRGELK